MQLFSADGPMFFFFKLIFFAHRKLKKLLSKVAQNSSSPFFFLTDQTDKTEEFIFQNVANWPTVYRTGIIGRKSSIGTCWKMNEGRVAGVIIIVASGNFKHLAYVSDKH